MKKKSVIIVCLVILLCLIGFGAYTINSNLNKIGKGITYDFTIEQTRDYTMIDTEEFMFMRDKTKAELKDYMKTNNLQFSAGHYLLNQSADVKHAKEVFRFEQMDKK